MQRLITHAVRQPEDLVSLLPSLRILADAVLLDDARELDAEDRTGLGRQRVLAFAGGRRSSGLSAVSLGFAHSSGGDGPLEKVLDGRSVYVSIYSWRLSDKKLSPSG